jgi:DNA-binding MarR family transcriptional regulator
MSKAISDQHPNPYNFPGFLLWVAANKWEKRINSVLSNSGLNHGEILHLISLYSLILSQEEVTQTQLAEMTGTTTMGVSKILTKLQKLGFITRAQGKDPRSKAINITEKGNLVLLSTATTLGQTDSDFFPAKGKTEFINYINQI